MKLYLKTKGSTPPSDHHYIIARNGKFIRKLNPFMDVTLRVHDIPSLEPQEEESNFSFPKIKYKEVFAVAGFFFQMYKKFGGESIVLIHWSPKHGYLFDAPLQEVCRQTIDYSPRDRFPGYLLTGSIHCHGRAIAFHSSGHAFSDYKDEADFDGLHITFGNINARIMTISCSAMVNGRRFMLDPLDYLGGIKEVKIVKTLPPPPTSKSKNAYCQQYAETAKQRSQNYYGSQSLLHGQYWAAHSGLKKWELLLPKGQKSVANNTFHYSRIDRFVYGSRRLFFGGSKANRSNGKKTEKAELLGNPSDKKIPFFFQLNLPEKFTVNELEFPNAWDKKVSKLPIIERVKLGLSCLSGGGKDANQWL